MNYVTVLFQVSHLVSKVETKEDISSQFQSLVSSAQRDKRHGIFFQNQKNWNQYVLILDYDNLLDKNKALETLRFDLEILVESINKVMNFTGIIGISEPYENTEQSFSAFLQAKFIVENTKITQGCKVISKNQFDQNYSDIQIDHEKIKELITAIEFGNRKQAKKIFDTIVKESCKEKRLLIQLCMTIQEVLIYLSNLLLKYGSNMYKVSNEYIDIFNRIWYMDSFEKLTEQCYLILQDVQTYIETIRCEGKESSVQQIQKYMNEHFKNQLV